MSKPVNNPLRRRFLRGLLALAPAGLLGSAAARAADSAADSADDLRFPGDPAEHRVVYQFNHADIDYMEHVLFSVGAMLRKYDTNVEIVVVVFGPGIHILGKRPERPVPELLRQRVASLSQYGVKFVACGNTMKSLGWDAEDILPFAEIEEVGAAALMEYQEKGFSYISW